MLTGKRIREMEIEKDLVRELKWSSTTKLQ